jgi:hypothetical protein
MYIFIKQFAAACSTGPGVNISFPTWYKYLNCDANGVPEVNKLTDLWRIGSSVLEMLIYIVGVLAVFFIIYGGIQFTTSQGQPDKIALAIMASAIVQFIFSRIGVSAPAVT